MANGFRYAVNCSILFAELPLLKRPAAAREAGFEAIEFWWPFDVADPADTEVERFAEAVGESGLELVNLNFFGGDLAAGDRGILSTPEREAEFQASVEIALTLGERLGCRMFNALYGLRLDGVAPERQDEQAIEQLAMAAEGAGRINGHVLVEPISGSERYPLRTASEAVDVMDRVQRRTSGRALWLLADLYHLATNGDDVAAAITNYGPRIGHVQIADAPGRNEPGTGELPLGQWLADLYEGGYRGWVALEYRASGSTVDSFGQLP